MKLRAHHIYCVPFLKMNLSERGQDFVQVENKIRQTMCKESGEPVEVVWGVDELCQVCPLCRGNRCHSPNGDEEEVRKLDSIILKELGVSVGTALTVNEWRKIIKQKSPPDFCNRCRVRSFCCVGSDEAV
jgi:hypothetical protein